MLVVSFGHEKRVGKDTCGKLLCSYLRTKTRNKSIQIEQLSYKLKNICHQLYSWAGLHTPEFYEVAEHQHLKDEVLPKLGKSPRRIWIDMGTHVGRAVYSETWIEYLWHNVSCDVMIITDMRFPNEAYRVLHYRGLCIKVHNPRIEPTSDEADDPLRTFDQWTDTIVNDDTLKVLNQRVVEMADQLILPRLGIYEKESMAKLAGGT